MAERVLVVGCGSIGQRHIRNLRTLGLSSIIAFDPLTERLDRAAREFGVDPCTSLERGLATKPDAVFVCTPPHLHTSIARQAVDRGAHVFVEKPIAHSLEGLDDLLHAARDRRRLLYVGYNLRFHRGLGKVKELLDTGTIGRLLMVRAEIGQYLPDWRPNQDYRTGYNINRSMGGGIILDASHELDYVRWLAGEVTAVYCAAGHLSRLEMDTEDSAAITLRFNHGVIAEVHLDCVQRGYTRTCKLIGEEGILHWDFNTGVRLLTNEKEWRDLPLAPDVNEMYTAELDHFLACVRGEASPLVDGGTGKRVLEIALAAKRSSETHAEVAV